MNKAILWVTSLLAVLAACGRSRLTEPTPVTRAFFQNTAPARVHRGEEFTFSVGMTAPSDLGQWDDGGLTFSLILPVDDDAAEVVSVDGDETRRNPRSVETPYGWGIIVLKHNFGSGSHVGFTARLRVKQDAPSGTYHGQMDGVAQNSSASFAELGIVRFDVQVVD